MHPFLQTKVAVWCCNGYNTMKRISNASRISVLSLCLALFLVSAISPWVLINEIPTEVISLTEEEGDCAHPVWQSTDHAHDKAATKTACLGHLAKNRSISFGWLLLPDYPPEES